MEHITFIDTEIDPQSGRVLDIGGVTFDGSKFHSGSADDFIRFLKGTSYICGHNIFNHDLKYIKNTISASGVDRRNCIDTLYLSPLLFPARPYHALLKDDKLQTDDLNNPLNDAQKAMDLFYDEMTAFKVLDPALRKIMYCLLRDKMEFSAFFQYVGYKENNIDIEAEIRSKFRGQICENADLPGIVSKSLIELAYCLALINAGSRYSITPPWVLRNYPSVENIMHLLRSRPCLKGCDYCKEALDIYKGLKKFFGFEAYRRYDGEPLQEKAVKAAIDNKSILAVFPTGGGKSITFQVPALMRGYSSKGLTVVISPLQSLMKDQVDNLERAGITEAVTINGLLDPIERSKSIERVESGSASILYISPESLRSRTIEKMLLGRNIARFVIDEAHCFSSWGQDFRVDYLYIGDFIKELQAKKNLEEGIPVSCFTATAKQRVIEDIKAYFKDKLSVDMEVYSAASGRSNLHYKVLAKNNEEEKYNTLRVLIETKKCPTIVYVSRTKKASDLAARLVGDGYQARAFHGKMEKQEKVANQDAFMNGEVQIMVATSAFGMGVDKKDVGMVIHYEISDSLENYVQEAGRAGRDENINADCYVLFNDEDLNKHFILLNQTKLTIREIQQIWSAIKGITRQRARTCQSALEIARKAGWDDSMAELETRVRTAIAALEDAGYVKRGQNVPRIYADGILAKNAAEAIDRINASDKFDEKKRVKAIRIIKSLISSKSRQHSKGEEAEARVDYIADHLGLEKAEVIQIVNLLREEKILADVKDLEAYIKRKENKNRSLAILKSFHSIEDFLLTVVENNEITVNVKELNQQAEQYGCIDVNINRIKTILNFWAIKNWINKRKLEYTNNHMAVICLQDLEALKEKLAKRFELAQFIIEYLYEKTNINKTAKDNDSEEILIEFSVMELKEEFEARLTLFDTKANSEDIEEALFYLSRIEALKIEGGFLVVYNSLTIERLEKDNKRRYKTEDYQKLNQFYESRVQQIHIVGEYARKMIDDYKAALEFVDDYFRMNYSMFLNKYFKGSRQNEIKRNITPDKFRQLFGELSPAQLRIINDNESKYIVVAAGPGSGKTRILVHKLASLLLMEDVKHEQLLMVTFSRAAATEFKKRLLKLIGNAANYVEIKTFHSYCFDLLGRVGTLEKSGEIVKEAIKKIREGAVEASRITKTVLVIDEAQDIDANEFELISTLMEMNEDMRVIAVGDDDQNIYEFRGASSKYMESLITEKKAVMYELVENYRSKWNLVSFTNQFVQRIPQRLKKTPIIAVQDDNGSLKIVKYRSSNLATPLAEDIIAESLSGSTCVLSKTNEEALQIAGLLVKEGIPAKLIQSNDGFNLYNLLEVRYFLGQLKLSDGIYIIEDDTWAAAKRKLAETFRTSINLEVCINMLRDFELTNPKKKYKSDLEVFIRESKLEDFIAGNMDTVFVSTIHKAKGREFDNVFLLLDQFSISTNEALRQLYVAMTRARQSLMIHYNGNYLNSINAEGARIIEDSGIYHAPCQLAIQLSHKDVWLDNFISCQSQISILNSGDMLLFDEVCCRNERGQAVLRFSKQFIRQMEAIKQKNYIPKKAIVRFILYWQKENNEREIKIVLPELYFERIDDIQDAQL